MTSRSMPDAGRSATVTAAALSAAVLIAQQVAGKATRDALFLSQFPAGALPVVMIASAVLSLSVTLVLGRLMLRSSPARVVWTVSLVSSGLFAFEWALSFPAPGVVAAAVYLHTAALGAVAVSCFWSVINEQFDPHTARIAVARIARGAAFGGVVGGVAAWQAGTRLPLPTMLIALAASSLVCAIGVARINAGSRRAPIAGRSPSAFHVLARVNYLRQLAALVALGAVAEVAVDYVFKFHASRSFATGQQLVSFFAIFYMSASVATFLLQSTLVSRVLHRVGPTGAVASQSVALTLGGVLGLAFPGLWSVTALRAGVATLGSSLYRSGYELLYTPLAPCRKRATKTLVDVGFDRVGNVLGGGVAMLAVAVVPAAAASLLMGVAVAASAVCLLITRRLHRGYVGALADRLRRGTVDLDSRRVQRAADALIAALGDKRFDVRYRAAVALAFRALAVDDDGVRGTALEYLENVIPPDIRHSLGLHWGGSASHRGPELAASLRWRPPDEVAIGKSAITDRPVHAVLAVGVQPRLRSQLAEHQGRIRRGSVGRSPPGGAARRGDGR